MYLGAIPVPTSPSALALGTVSPQGREIHKRGFLALGKALRTRTLVTSPTMYAIKLRKWKDPVRNISTIQYTGCPRRNVKYFGRVFLMLNYADITQNTNIQSWTVTELMAIEKCGLLLCPRTVRRPWRNIDPLRKPGKAIASCSDLDERFIFR